MLHFAIERCKARIQTKIILRGTSTFQEYSSILNMLCVCVGAGHYWPDPKFFWQLARSPVSWQCRPVHLYMPPNMQDGGICRCTGLHFKKTWDLARGGSPRDHRDRAQIPVCQGLLHVGARYQEFQEEARGPPCQEGQRDVDFLLIAVG
jgi:hypothetical protein